MDASTAPAHTHSYAYMCSGNRHMPHAAAEATAGERRKLNKQIAETKSMRVRGLLAHCATQRRLHHQAHPDLCLYVLLAYWEYVISAQWAMDAGSSPAVRLIAIATRSRDCKLNFADMCMCICKCNESASIHIYILIYLLKESCVNTRVV